MWKYRAVNLICALDIATSSCQGLVVACTIVSTLRQPSSDVPFHKWRLLYSALLIAVLGALAGLAGIRGCWNRAPKLVLAYLGWRVVLWAYTGLSYIGVFQVGIEAKFVEASLALALNCTLGVYVLWLIRSLVAELPSLSPLHTRHGSFSRVMFDEDRFSDDEARFSPVCVGEDLEDDPMTSEMFRAESVSDMRRLARAVGSLAEKQAAAGGVTPC